MIFMMIKWNKARKCLALTISMLFLASLLRLLVCWPGRVKSIFFLPLSSLLHKSIWGSNANPRVREKTPPRTLSYSTQTTSVTKSIHSFPHIPSTPTEAIDWVFLISIQFWQYLPQASQVSQAKGWVLQDYPSLQSKSQVVGCYLHCWLAI